MSDTAAYSVLKNTIQSDKCTVLTDSPMSRQTSFKVGGDAKLIAFPQTEDALIHAVLEAKKLSLPVLTIGNGSNLLIRDCGIDAVIIKTTSMDSDITINGDTIKCSAGTPLSKLCMVAYENSLTGLEFAYGIPGTVGGAVYMNAGAYGGEIKDVIDSSRHITPKGEIEELNASSLELSYRHSFYSDKPDYIITGASFKLTHGDKAQIKAKMDDFMQRRRDKQPLEYPSAGSTFKRPKGYFAGALIEQCNLKGYTIGGASVSEKHAGFVINSNNATATDVLDLIDYVKETVKKETGVTLEPEVKILP